MNDLNYSTNFCNIKTLIQIIKKLISSKLINAENTAILSAIIWMIMEIFLRVWFLKKFKITQAIRKKKSWN